MGCHDVHFVKGLVAGRTFPHAIRESRLQTALAEDVATSLDNGILEVLPTYRAKGKFLAGG